MNNMEIPKTSFLDLKFFFPCFYNKTFHPVDSNKLEVNEASYFQYWKSSLFCFKTKRYPIVNTYSKNVFKIICSHLSSNGLPRLRFDYRLFRVACYYCREEVQTGSIDDSDLGFQAKIVRLDQQHRNKNQMLQEIAKRLIAKYGKKFYTRQYRRSAVAVYKDGRCYSAAILIK